MKLKNKAVIIFDNAGGVTLKLDNNNFCCHYPDTDSAIKDLVVYFDDGNCEGWEGHNESLVTFEPSLDSVRNGGYQIIQIEDDNVLNQIDWGIRESFRQSLQKAIAKTYVKLQYYSISRATDKKSAVLNYDLYQSPSFKKWARSLHKNVWVEMPENIAGYTSYQNSIEFVKRV